MCLVEEGLHGCYLDIDILGVGISVLTQEGKVVVSLGEGNKCSVTVFLRMRRMSSRLLCRMDPVTDAEWELLVG